MTVEVKGMGAKKREGENRMRGGIGRMCGGEEGKVERG